MDFMKDKHPIGLRVLFFTEMWERFSYYGMRALLALYLTKHLNFTDSEAGQLYGIYTAFVYLTPLLGGYIADRFLGNRAAIYIGGFLMMFGHLSLAIDKLIFFYIGLGLLILGNGFFKPNISTMLGRLYEEKPHLRESAFTYFYMGINIGGSVGPLLCGFIGEKLGWHFGFGLAGLGMLTGLLQLYFGKKFLGEIGKSPKQIMPHEHSTKAKLSFEDKKKVLFIILLSLTSVFFWVPYEQMGSSINLYTDRRVDRVLFGVEIPASVFQSVNGFLILIFAPFMAKFWDFLNKNSRDFSLVSKIIFSFLFLGVSHLVLYLGEFFAEEKVSLLFLMLYYILLTIGELCISPIGLSTVAKIAPVQIGSLLMGVWFLSNAVSHYISGWLAGEYAKWFKVEEFFLFLFGISLVASIILFVFKNKMNKLIVEEN